MGQRLTLFPLAGLWEPIGEAEVLKGADVMPLTRIDFKEDSPLLERLGLWGKQTPRFPVHEFPGRVDTGHLSDGPFRYFMAGDFQNFFGLTPPEKSWDNAVIALLNQLPPETVIVFKN